MHGTTDVSLKHALFFLRFTHFLTEHFVNKRNFPFPASPFLFFKTLQEPKKQKIELLCFSFLKLLSVPNNCTASAPLLCSVVGEQEKRGEMSSVGGLVCDRGTGKK